jgi:hypothetical protein
MVTEDRLGADPMPHSATLEAARQRGGALQAHMLLEAFVVHHEANTGHEAPEHFTIPCILDQHTLVTECKQFISDEQERVIGIEVLRLFLPRGLDVTSRHTQH